MVDLDKYFSIHGEIRQIYWYLLLWNLLYLDLRCVTIGRCISYFTCTKYSLQVCPKFWRSWRSILVSDSASVRASARSPRTVHARVLIFNVWIPHGKILVFSCPNYFPFWSYALLNKSGMKSVACRILWTVHARVLKFYIWIPHGKHSRPIFFFLVLVLVFELVAWSLVRWYGLIGRLPD